MSSIPVDRRPRLTVSRHDGRSPAVVVRRRALGARSPTLVSAGLTLMAVGLALFVSPAPAQDATHEPRPALDATDRVRSLVKLEFPILDIVAPSPRGRFIAALQTRPRPVIWVVPTDGGEPFAFRESWSAYRPRWARSGQRIGFIAAGGPPRVWTVEVDTATGRAIDPPRLLIRTVASVFAFSGDGERVALVPTASVAAGAAEIRVVRWESRAERVVVRDEGLIYWLDWSPDDAAIYYGLAPVAADSAHRIRRVPIHSGRPTTLADVGEFLGLAPDGRYLLYRPGDVGADADTTVVEVADTGGEPLRRIVVPPGTAPRWGPTSSSLLVVRSETERSEILEIPVDLP